MGCVGCALILLGAALCSPCDTRSPPPTAAAWMSLVPRLRSLEIENAADWTIGRAARFPQGEAGGVGGLRRSTLVRWRPAGRNLGRGSPLAQWQGRCSPALKDSKTPTRAPVADVKQMTPHTHCKTTAGVLFPLLAGLTRLELTYCGEEGLPAVPEHLGSLPGLVSLSLQVGTGRADAPLLCPPCHARPAGLFICWCGGSCTQAGRAECLACGLSAAGRLQWHSLVGRGAAAAGAAAAGILPAQVLQSLSRSAAHGSLHCRPRPWPAGQPVGQPDGIGRAAALHPAAGRQGPGVL